MKLQNLLFLSSFLFMHPLAMVAQEELPKSIQIGRERVKVRKEVKLPKIAGRTPLKCDFHIHTIFSDGIVWPSLRVQEAWEEGLDAIAITDHIEGQPARPGIEKGDHNRSYEYACTEALKKDIILIRGGEITRGMPPGHLNALFINDVNVLDQPDYMKAIEDAHLQGAFIEWNHPGWGVDSIKWHDVHETLYRKGWLNGIEVFNEFEWYPEALNWVNEKNLTLIANTDVHDVNERLYDFTTTANRPMTLVLAKERTAESIREALFARQTLIWFFDTLMGRQEYLEEFFRNSVVTGNVHYETEKKKYVTLYNHYDVPFRLRCVEEGITGYPQMLELPASSSIVITLPNVAELNDGVLYEVENMIVSPREKLRVKMF